MDPPPLPDNGIFSSSPSLSSGPPPPPPPPPTKQTPEQKRQKLEKRILERTIKRVKEEENEVMSKIDFENMAKPYDISIPVRWKEIKRATCTESGEGSNGVFFVQTRHNEVFVMKGSSFLADEVFASRISSLFGVRTPKCDIIEWRPGLTKRHSSRGTEWYDCRDAFLRIGKLNERLKRRFEKNMDRGFYLLMEFIPGISMTNQVKKQLVHNYMESSVHMRDLGRIFVFDLVINNYDRFPTPDIFDHEGNPENLLFLEKQVVAIDQSVNPFNKRELKEDYLEKVKKVVKEHKKGFSLMETLLRNNEEKKKNDDDDDYEDCKVQFLHNNVYITSICDFVKKNSWYYYTWMEDFGRKEIWIGMDEVFKCLRQQSSSGTSLYENLKRLKKEVKELLTGEDWADVYKDSLDRIDIEFIFDVIKTMRDTYDE